MSAFVEKQPQAKRKTFFWVFFIYGRIRNHIIYYFIITDYFELSSTDLNLVFPNPGRLEEFVPPLKKLEMENVHWPIILELQ